MDNTCFIDLFESYLRVEKRSSPHTILAYKTDLLQFCAHLSILNPSKLVIDITRADLRSWLVSLTKEGLSSYSINRKIASLRAFYLFLKKRGNVTSNPMLQIKSLKNKKRLPIFFQEKALLSFLDQHDFPTTFSGLRDKLVLELLYGTGIRLAEILTLQETDINHCDATIKVKGKRNKERIVPFPRPLKRLIESYCIEKKKRNHPNGTPLIVTDRGKAGYPMFIYRIVKKYLMATIQASQYSPHILRHTFATHLLDKGADLQAIKELLGHASLAATQVYTHNSLSKLKEIFKKAHPRAEEEV